MMNFQEFKNKYLKTPVIEYPNKRSGKNAILTVKVVTYNHANYISECLNSIIMQQTNFDFEILIAEDDSSDGTRDICIKYAEKYPDKIKLLLNSRENNLTINNKPSGTFNSVYANFSINSKYITMIEGDDYWMDVKSLQKRVNFLENNEDHVLCFHNSKVYDENLKKVTKDYLLNFKESISFEKNKTLNLQMPTSTLMYRNNLVELFDEKMIKIIHGDVILKGKLAHFGKARYIHEIKPSMYRVHDKGIYSGASVDDNIKGSVDARLYLLEYYKEKNWNINLIYDNLANMFFVFFIKKIVKEKKIKINYLYTSFLYSKRSEFSFFKVLNFFIFRLKNYKF